MDKLLCAVLIPLNRDFITGHNPEILLSTEITRKGVHKETTDHLVLIGASRLKGLSHEIFRRRIGN